MQSLIITPNRHYLQYPDGRPFFYLGDTAWELFHRLTREEADAYLQNRAAKGFTVIQAVALAEMDGLRTPNAYGDLPLHNLDPATPNEAYFEVVDYMVARAAELGMFTGMLPTWGDKVPEKAWGEGPEVFTPENAYTYGRFLGARYREQPIVWILGGDRAADTPEKLAIWRAMARGLHEGDDGAHLITFHCWGRHRSSEYVHDEPWLDFNMMQSGHNQRHMPNDAMVRADYFLQPTKPTLDGEPRYEDHPVDWNPEYGYFDDRDVRQALYWGLLGGGCGITYGCHDIWQFWQPGRTPISHARTPWQEAIDLPGSTQAGYARALYERRPFTRLVPDQGAIVAGGNFGRNHVAVATADDGSFLFAYIPEGEALTLDLGRIAGPQARAYWYDPRSGAWQPIGDLPTGRAHKFTPPSSGWGQDWVLVVDDAAAGYAVPES